MIQEHSIVNISSNDLTIATAFDESMFNDHFAQRGATALDMVMTQAILSRLGFITGRNMSMIEHVNANQRVGDQ